MNAKRNVGFLLLITLSLIAIDFTNGLRKKFIGHRRWKPIGLPDFPTQIPPHRPPMLPPNKPPKVQPLLPIELPTFKPPCNCCCHPCPCDSHPSIDVLTKSHNL